MNEPDSQIGIMKIDYLKFALEDAQDIIRASDQKAGLVITVVAIVTALTGSVLGAGSAKIESLPFAWIMFVGFVFLTLALAFSLGAVWPISDPARYVIMGSIEYPAVRFFLGTLIKVEIESHHDDDPRSAGCWDVVFRPRRIRVSPELSSAVDTIESAIPEDIVQTLVFEVLKTSYIRDRKLKYVMVAYTSLTSGLFILLVWVTLLAIYR